LLVRYQAKDTIPEQEAAADKAESSRLTRPSQTSIEAAGGLTGQWGIKLPARMRLVLVAGGYFDRPTCGRENALIAVTVARRAQWKKAEARRAPWRRLLGNHGLAWPSKDNKWCNRQGPSVCEMALHKCLLAKMRGTVVVVLANR